jgi:hypothetical protein
MPDRRRELLKKRPASHTLLSMDLFIPCELRPRKGEAEKSAAGGEGQAIADCRSQIAEVKTWTNCRIFELTNWGQVLNRSGRREKGAANPVNSKTLAADGPDGHGSRAGGRQS